MRSIFYIAAGPDNQDKLLKIGSKYTPLVEPVDNCGAFLDLSGCEGLNEMVRDMGHVLTPRKTISLGWASNKLVARIAATRRSLPGHDAKSPLYRIFSLKQIRIVQVFPGREAGFMASLPLDEFYPLTPGILGQLSRLGFSTVGEIAAMDSEKFFSLARKNAYLLARYSQGMDSAPVLGLYPPRQIIYPHCFERETSNQLEIEQVLEKATLKLSTRLARQHAGCRRISLELFDGWEKSIEHRTLNHQCSSSKELYYILQGLLRLFELTRPLSEIRIYLGEIEPLQFMQQDLFTNRAAHNPKEDTKAVLTGLQARFPGKIGQGLNVNRREKVLALWDPWRY
ncbi:MAG: hypothetical protein ACOX0E_06910 [Syntrophomonadaceae bacterium]|jgi:nucleotidyltransferase/DNA polymerase involved in DNA repair